MKIVCQPSLVSAIHFPKEVVADALIEKRRKIATLPRMPSRKAKGKAKGNFFSDKITLSYAAKGVVRGQATNDACVPAVCRMLIFDRFPQLENDINFSESYLRHFLNTDEHGSVIADIPTVLRLAQSTSMSIAPT